MLGVYKQVEALKPDLLKPPVVQSQSALYNRSLLFKATSVIVKTASSTATLLLSLCSLSSAAG